MSTQEHGSSIAEYKRRDFLKYCNENGIKKYQFKELSILNKHHKSGLFYIKQRNLISIKMKVFFCVCGTLNNITLTTTKIKHENN